MTYRYFRYDAQRFSIVIDAEMDMYGTSDPRLHCTLFYVTGETPKGVWVGYHKGQKHRWVSNTAKKKFAYPTEAEALEGYIRRKEAFVRHSTNRLARARADLKLGELANAKP